MSKKMKLESTEDIEELYQKFKKKMLKSFRNGDSAEGSGERMLNWVMKKAHLDEEAAVVVVSNFVEVLLKDESIDKQEEREEK